MTTPVKQPINDSLKNDMWRACDILRRDNNVGGIIEYTEHLAWLLFLKFLDQEEKRRATEAGLNGYEYEAVLQNDLAWDSWAGPAKVRDWKADELIQFVRGRLLPGLAVLTGSDLARTVARMFSDESVGDTNVLRNIPVCASGYNLKDVLEIINSIHFERKDDVFTITQFYEDLLERMGNENRIAGEFHTPRSVINFVVDVIAPQVGETVYDPAYGSAGFLSQAFLYMDHQVQTVEQHTTLQTRTFFGQEKKGLAALLGTMNMVLHGVSAPQLTRANTLEENVKGDVRGRYDIILANPPFGGTEGRHIQENFTVRATATELLFLQHIIKKLKKTPNARAGIVVPEGTLFRGGTFAEVKKDLMDYFHLFAVVSLPPGAFAPYSDVKTALLFFQRPDSVLAHNPRARHETWYYELPLPDGLKKFSKGQRIADAHFAEARDLWLRWQAYLFGEAERPFAYAADLHQSGPGPRNDVSERSKQLSLDLDEPTAPLPPPTSSSQAAAHPNAWIEVSEDLRDREYDLSARNPIKIASATLPHPSELTASLLERTRELHSLLENLHAMLTNGEDE